MELPLRLLQPFLGARIVKTGLAVFLALAVFHWFGSQYATFAAVAAILAIQPAITKAREVFRQQLLGNVVAGAIATLIGFLLEPNPITMALGAVLVLGILVRFRLSEAAGLAVVMILFIMDRPEHDYFMYTVARVGAVTGGMAIGYAVNRYIKPPDLWGRAREEIREATAEMDRFLDRIDAALGTPESYRKEEIKQDGGAIQKRLETARAFLEMATGEMPEARLLVLKKANASMFVFLEAGMAIHKLLLPTGGLTGADEEAVRAGLHAAREYKRTVMAAALDGGEAGAEPGAAFAAAMIALQQRMEELVDQREQRPLGLTLHGVLSHLRHMGTRMDSLRRLLNQFTHLAGSTFRM